MVIRDSVAVDTIAGTVSMVMEDMLEPLMVAFLAVDTEVTEILVTGLPRIHTVLVEIHMARIAVTQATHRDTEVIHESNEM